MSAVVVHCAVCTPNARVSLRKNVAAGARQRAVTARALNGARPFVQSSEVHATDAPGEGKRRAPEVEEKEDNDEVAPPPGPQVTSKGVAPSEVETPSEAYKNVTPTATATAPSEAPGEGAKRRPEGEEMQCQGEECDAGYAPEPFPGGACGGDFDIA